MAHKNKRPIPGIVKATFASLASLRSWRPIDACPTLFFAAEQSEGLSYLPNARVSTKQSANAHHERQGCDVSVPFGANDSRLIGLSFSCKWSLSLFWKKTRSRCHAAFNQREINVPSSFDRGINKKVRGGREDIAYATPDECQSNKE